MKRVLATVALTAVLVAGGATAAVATWTAVAAKNASVTNAAVVTTSSGIPNLAASYKAGLPGVFAAQLSDTAAVTVTNTGTAPLGYTLTTTGGTAALNSAVTLQVWKAAAPCDSTSPVGANATTGTLSVPPAMPSDANSAAIGASLSLCIRTSITAAQHATNISTSTMPTVTVTGKVGANWTAASSASFTQSVSYNWVRIVHKNSGKCMDANGGSATANTNLILYPCKALMAADNQAFRFEAIGAFFRIFIGSGTAANPIVRAPLVTGGQVQLQNIDTTGTSANWEQWTIVAHGATGDFQIKSRTGACLAMNSSNDLTVFVTATCTASVDTASTAYRAQHFTFTDIP